MPNDALQSLCERGQRELMATEYLSAVRTLAAAEQIAWDNRDFDTLSRLYLPLQEARRQIRQRCGDGAVAMHCFPSSDSESIDPTQLIETTPQGQLLVGGWGTIQPAVQLRKLAAEKSLYLETFLAAVYPILNADPVVVIVPLELAMPDPQPRQLSELLQQIPAGSLLLSAGNLPADEAKGTAETYAGVMALWERLHQPFLNAAAAEPDAMLRMQQYRLALRVDPACELAHQFLADIARKLARG